MSKLPLVLASSSPYRQTLLNKLQLQFITHSPDVPEDRQADETPANLASRLSIAKAHALKRLYNQHLIIGSDQVAALHDQIFGKPGNRDTAIQQLQMASGNCVKFFTSLCLLNTLTGEYFTDLDVTLVYFKSLSTAQIERYVDLDKPFDCAGSFKAEGLGIVLFERIKSSDPNALIGLPLIKLITLLQKFQVNLL